MRRKEFHDRITWAPKGNPSKILTTIKIYSNKLLSSKELKRVKWWNAEIYRDPRNDSIYLYDVIEAPLDNDGPAKPETDDVLIGRVMAWARGDGYSHLVIEYDEVLNGWIVDIDDYRF